MYHTAKPYPSNKIGKRIWESTDGRNSVYEFQRRFELVRDGVHVANLINGVDSLKKKYDSSFEKWIESVRKKDMKKVAKLMDMAKTVKKDAGFISNLWV